MTSRIDFQSIHALCGWHDQIILRGTICGCFYCISLFMPSDIEEWIEEPSDCPRGLGKTALCPNCGIDAVLPDTIELSLTPELLKAMHEKYF
jgi:hypothetical protein